MAWFKPIKNIVGRIKARLVGSGTEAPPPNADQRTPDAADDWLYNGSWLTVASSNVDEIRYLYDEQILEMKFLWGGVYQYYNVPPDVAQKLYHTDSPGRFQWNVLRAGNYEYGKLTALSPTSEERRAAGKPKSNVVRVLSEEEATRRGLPPP